MSINLREDSALRLLSVVSLVVPLLYLAGQTTSGRDFWQSLGENERIVLVQGIYTGLYESLNVMIEQAKREKNRDPYWSPPFVHAYSANRLKEYFPSEEEFDYSLIVGILDAFYSNPDNAHIGIMYALRVIALNQKGQTRRANELLLIKQKEVLKGR